MCRRSQIDYAAQTDKTLKLVSSFTFRDSQASAYPEDAYQDSCPVIGFLLPY